MIWEYLRRFCTWRYYNTRVTGRPGKSCGCRRSLGCTICSAVGGVVQSGGSCLGGCGMARLNGRHSLRPLGVDVRLSLVLILFSLVMLLPEALCAQDATHIAKKDGRFALMVEGRPYPMLGAQINNSSAWASSLPEVWPALEGLQVNTMGSARNAALKNA